MCREHFRIVGDEQLGLNGSAAVDEGDRWALTDLSAKQCTKPAFGAPSVFVKPSFSLVRLPWDFDACLSGLGAEGL